MWRFCYLLALVTGACVDIEIGNSTGVPGAVGDVEVSDEAQQLEPDPQSGANRGRLFCPTACQVWLVQPNGQFGHWTENGAIVSLDGQVVSGEYIFPVGKGYHHL